ncbi:MAG: hypothetical protein V5A15_01720 [Haloarcula sp.]
MRRRRYLTTLGAAMTASLAGCSADGNDTPDSTPTGTQTTTPTLTPTDSSTPNPTRTPTPRPGLTNPSFEDGLAGWTVGRDLPEDPNDPGTPVASTVEASSAQASVGSQSVRMELDGSADDGTVWVGQGADFGDVDTLRVDCYSEEATFNILAELAVYTGPMPEGGLSEADFDTSEQTGDHAGWKTYEYPIEFTGTGVVAVGMNVVWETTVERFFDEVRLVADGGDR